MLLSCVNIGPFMEGGRESDTPTPLHKHTEATSLLTWPEMQKESCLGIFQPFFNLEISHLVRAYLVINVFFQ